MTVTDRAHPPTEPDGSRLAAGVRRGWGAGRPNTVCDAAIARDGGQSGRAGPKVESFDGGYGSGLLARMVGQGKAREIGFRCRQFDVAQALEMGMVNTGVPLADLERETVHCDLVGGDLAWGAREPALKSPPTPRRGQDLTQFCHRS